MLVGKRAREFVFVPLFGRDSLWHSNVKQDGNDKQIKAVFDYFDLYKSLEK
jgi:hypothetical protein